MEATMVPPDANDGRDENKENVVVGSTMDDGVVDDSRTVLCKSDDEKLAMECDGSFPSGMEAHDARVFSFTNNANGFHGEVTTGAEDNERSSAVMEAIVESHGGNDVAALFSDQLKKLEALWYKSDQRLDDEELKAFRDKIARIESKERRAFDWIVSAEHHCEEGEAQILDMVRALEEVKRIEAVLLANIEAHHIESELQSFVAPELFEQRERDYSESLQQLRQVNEKLSEDVHVISNYLQDIRQKRKEALKNMPQQFLEDLHFLEITFVQLARISELKSQIGMF